MTHYELMVIIDQNAGEKGIEKILETLKDLIKTHNGKIEKEDIWGERTLAYKINSSAKGYYVLFDLKIEGKELKELTKGINLTKGIWRNLFVKKGE